MGVLAPEMVSGSLLAHYRMKWGPIYEAVLDILGSTGTILPFGDPSHLLTPTTFETVGEEQITFTYSEAPTDWDTPFNQTDSDSYRGIVPVFDFNGTDEEADTPNNAYWSRGDGSNDSPFSVGAWVRPNNTAASKGILGKWESSFAGREWRFQVTLSERFTFTLRDESESVESSRATSSVLSTTALSFVVATYGGASGAVAGDDIHAYINGALNDGATRNNANYVAMETGAAEMELSQLDGNAFQFSGQIIGGPLGPFFTQTELSADAIRQLYLATRGALAV